MPYNGETVIFNDIEVSQYTLDYYNLWKKTLHDNNCKENDGGCTGKCDEGATGLAMSRLESIKRGMPDIPLEEDRQIMTRAFVIHQQRVKFNEEGHKADWSSGTMTPSWTTGPHQCRCYEDARHQLIIERVLRDQNTPVIIVKAEDAWYEPRFE